LGPASASYVPSAARLLSAVALRPPPGREAVAERRTYPQPDVLEADYNELPAIRQEPKEPPPLEQPPPNMIIVRNTGGASEYRRFKCPFCGSGDYPISKNRISQTSLDSVFRFACYMHVSGMQDTLAGLQGELSQLRRMRDELRNRRLKAMALAEPIWAKPIDIPTEAFGTGGQAEWGRVAVNYKRRDACAVSSSRSIRRLFLTPQPRPLQPRARARWCPETAETA